MHTDISRLGMAELLNIAAISIGFVAAVCFCIGAATSDAKQISGISGTYWAFNKSLARSLAAQRAQYVVGAVLLVISFSLQAAAVLASQSNPAFLPQWMPRGACLFLAVLVPTALLAWLAVRVIAASTASKVIRLLEEKSKE